MSFRFLPHFFVTTGTGHNSVHCLLKVYINRGLGNTPARVVVWVFYPEPAAKGISWQSSQLYKQKSRIEGRKYSRRPNEVFYYILIVKFVGPDWLYSQLSSLN